MRARQDPSSLRARLSLHGINGRPLRSHTKTDISFLLSFFSLRISALTGLVTEPLRARSPRECRRPAPTVSSGDEDLRWFTFRQHDQYLAEQRTGEAFAGASERSAHNVAE